MCFRFSLLIIVTTFCFGILSLPKGFCESTTETVFQKLSNALWERLKKVNLENNSTNSPIQLAVHDIKYHDSKAGSQFGRYLSNNIHGLLEHDNKFRVIKYQKTKQIVGMTSKRGINLTQKKNTYNTITTQIGATHYLKGDYRISAKGTIELSLGVYNTNNDLVVSVNQTMEKRFFPENLSFKPEKTTPIIKKKISILPRSSRPLEISLHSSRGDGGTYYDGEKFSIFFSTNQPCYARVYYLQSDGSILEIFPDIDGGNGLVKKEIVYAIPDPELEYEYEVSEPYGFEEIFAIVSSEPLPLPGEKGESGFREYPGEYEELLTELFPSTFKGKKAEKSIMITTIPKE